MMKVLMVNKFLYPNGGSETYIFKIGEYLRSQGIDVQYFGMEHEGRIVQNELELYTSNMDFHSSKLQKLLYPFKIIYSTEAKKKLSKILYKLEPDVVHLNNINFQLTPSVIDAVVGYKKKTGRHVKLIYTAHDYQWVCPNHMMRRQGQNCEACAEGAFGNCARYNCIHGSKVKSILGTIEADLYKMKKTYGYVDTIICPSSFMKSKLDKSEILRNKTVMLRNFIDHKNVDNIEEMKETADNGQVTDNTTENERHQSEKDYVLYLGRFSEEKGMKTLLKACQSARTAEGNLIPFIFAGSGPLEAEVNAVSNVENKGFVTGNLLQDLIQNARFSIYPSEWYENGPFSIMESIQAGTPVIGADIGGIPELIQDEKTGLLFESGNADELRQKIERLWNNKEENEAYSSNCKAIMFDTVASYCEKLLKIYQK